MERCWCEINPDAIEKNYRFLLSKIPTGASLMPIVKANGYGHGIVTVSRVLEKIGCGHYGCAILDEGVRLREAGIRGEILLLSAVLESEVEEAVARDLTMTVSDPAEADWMIGAARKLGKHALVQLKIDTGMGRLGVHHSKAMELYDKIKTAGELSLRGIYTHLASAWSDRERTREQLRLFEPFRKLHPCHHTSNSAAILDQADPFSMLYRPGLSLYGACPMGQMDDFLVPALSWKSRVTLVKEVERGSRLSYEGTFVAPSRMRIATLAVGYGDGLFVSLSGKGRVLIRGELCPILGRVTMDQILVDVGHLPECKSGDEVVLIGRSGNRCLRVNDLARHGNLLAYEILTHITERVPRITQN